MDVPITNILIRMNIQTILRFIYKNHQAEPICINLIAKSLLQMLQRINLNPLQVSLRSITLTVTFLMSKR